jgi:hypothetical protein
MVANYYIYADDLWVTNIAARMFVNVPQNEEHKSIKRCSKLQTGQTVFKVKRI